jgi:hypothetical protein
MEFKRGKKFSAISASAAGGTTSANAGFLYSFGAIALLYYYYFCVGLPGLMYFRESIFLFDQPSLSLRLPS